jgi:serine/threonine-protein kinase
VSGTDRPARGVGLTLKMFLATAGVVVVVLSVALVITGWVANAAAERSLDRQLVAADRSVRRLLDAQHSELARAASAATQIPTILSNIVQSFSDTVAGPSSVLDMAGQYAEIVGAGFTVVTDNAGVRWAQSDNPNASRAALAEDPLVAGALEGRATAGFINRADTALYLATATPLADLASGVVHGVLVSAHRVTDSLAAEMQRGTATEIVFYVVDAEGRPRPVAASLVRGPALDSAVGSAAIAAAGAGEMRATLTVDGDALVGFGRALTNPGSDQPEGGYIALRSRAAELAPFRRLQRTLGIVGLVGLLLALVASYVLARQIAKPVRALAGAARRVADGEYATDLPAGGRDEIGQLAASFRHMLEELKAKQQLVDFLSTSAQAAVTQPVYTAGGDLATPTMVRSMAGGTGMALVPGQTFAGRYEIKAVLGVGGMGVVYRAMDRELGELVAIKTLKTDAMASDPAMLQRFKDEIRLARKITHRNVVRTHDLGEVEGMYYITMEFVEGQSLKQLIQARGRLPVNVMLTVGKQLCRALEVAHEQGVIHRDIKPQNIVVEPSGTIKVMDFGIARLATRTDGVTQAGMAIGTPEYMAPEQLLGENVDFRADLYATGCVLFECLIGHPPFTADSPITLVAKQLEEAPPSPSALNAEVPEPLAALIVRTLSKDAAQRPQSATELHDALDAVTA